jgi:hypothetical protein
LTRDRRNLPGALKNSKECLGWIWQSLSRRRVAVAGPFQRLGKIATRGGSRGNCLPLVEEELVVHHPLRTPSEAPSLPAKAKDQSPQVAGEGDIDGSSGSGFGGGRMRPHAESTGAMRSNGIANRRSFIRRCSSGHSRSRSTPRLSAQRCSHSRQR